MKIESLCNDCFLYSFLQEYVKKHKMSNMIAFVDPATIGALGCGNPAERSRSLSLRFRNAQPGQIFLLPYNSGSVLVFNTYMLSK